MNTKRKKEKLKQIIVKEDIINKFSVNPNITSDKWKNIANTIVDEVVEIRTTQSRNGDLHHNVRAAKNGYETSKLSNIKVDLSLLASFSSQLPNLLGITDNFNNKLLICITVLSLLALVQKNFSRSITTESAFVFLLIAERSQFKNPIPKDLIADIANEIYEKERDNLKFNKDKIFTDNNKVRSCILDELEELGCIAYIDRDGCGGYVSRERCKVIIEDFYSNIS